MRKNSFVTIIVFVFALSILSMAAEEQKPQPAPASNLATPAPKPAAATPAPAAPAAAAAPEIDTSDFNAIQLPPKDSLEYWVIREQSLSDLVPFLTKKRAEMKQKRQILADYLLQIGRAEDFAAQTIEVPDDPKLYAMAFGVLKGLEQKNIDVSKIQMKQRPDWDGVVEFAMKNAIYEGYVPTQVEEGDEFQMYKDMVMKKEQYGRKVHSELRPLAQQCLKAWIYLGQINEQENLKAYVAEKKLQAKQADEALQTQLQEQKRSTAYEHAMARDEKRFEQSMDRSRQDRHDERQDYRQDALLFRQSRLDDRYTGRYYD